MDAAVTSALPLAKREADVVVQLLGAPRGKGMPRARFVPPKGDRAGFVHHYQDADTNKYEAMLRYAGERAMRAAGFERPFDCALRGRITAVFPVPSSWSGKKAAQALGGLIRPTGKPDDDNLIKVRDGLKGVVFKDDALFVETVVRKFYGQQPLYQLEVWRFTGLVL